MSRLSTVRRWLRGRWRRRHPLGAERLVLSLVQPSLLLGALVIATGTAGYMAIEGWTFRESLYMTVITLSTVGFGEVHDLSDGGRMFTVGLIVGGVASLGVALVGIGERLRGAPRRRLERRIQRMKNHIIVCGYGRIARTVVPGLIREGYRVNVIEEDAEVAEAAIRKAIPVLRGDATSEEVLERAGVRRAAVVAALLPNDGDNLVITMTATGLQPNIRVVARSEQERSVANLERAGAHPQDVVSPHRTAGELLLWMLTHEGAARLTRGIQDVAGGHFDTGALPVTADSPLVGKSVAEAAIGGETNILALAVTSPSGEVTLAPRGSQRLEIGDQLTLLGRPEDLRELGVQLDGPPEHLAE